MTQKKRTLTLRFDSPFQFFFLRCLSINFINNTQLTMISDIERYLLSNNLPFLDAFDLCLYNKSVSKTGSIFQTRNSKLFGKLIANLLPLEDGILGETQFRTSTAMIKHLLRVN